MVDGFGNNLIIDNSNGFDNGFSNFNNGIIIGNNNKTKEKIILYIDDNKYEWDNFNVDNSKMIYIKGQKYVVLRQSDDILKIMHENDHTEHKGGGNDHKHKEGHNKYDICYIVKAKSVTVTYEIQKNGNHTKKVTTITTYTFELDLKPQSNPVLPIYSYSTSCSSSSSFPSF
jgi:hypothetical protein